MRLLEPWLRADSLSSVDLGALRRQGIDTLLIDMDNTLVPWHTFDVDEATRGWLDRAEALGFKICIISNNKKWRIMKIAEMLGVKGVWNACKPLVGGYLKALGKVDSRSRSAVFVGDQVFTDLLGANLLGIRTILVNPISRHEYKWTQFMRRLERRVAGRTIKGEAGEHGE
jgi:HAD superfamily phosphatase (TIGR01668 family)